MALPDPKTLDVVADGVPFVRVDLVGTSNNLDVVADGVPWVGYQEQTTPSIIFSPFWYYNPVLEAI